MSSCNRRRAGGGCDQDVIAYTCANWAAIPDEMNATMTIQRSRAWEKMPPQAALVSPVGAPILWGSLL